MATASASINPPQPSTASTAASTTSTWSPAASNQASAVSPPVPSTASSVSSPPAVPGPAFFHHHGHLHPHPPGISSSSSSSAAAPPSQQHQQQHLNATLPSPSAERQVAEARTALVASIGNMLDSELRGRAAVLHASDAAIAQQERDVARAADGLRRENDKLARVATDAARQVKELGNVQNWAEVLEREFLVIEETLRLVKEGSEGSGSGSWSGSSAGSFTASNGGSREGSVARGGEDGRKQLLDGDGDGDARMEDPAEQDSSATKRIDKGKANETVPEDHDMDVDVPVTDNTQIGGPAMDGPALKIPDVDVPGVSVHKALAPRLNIPGREPSNISQASLEDELKSAMDQPIGGAAGPPVEAW